MDQNSGFIDIQDFLPHRQPMLMVDHVVEICKEKVTTTFKVSENNIFLYNNQLQESGIIENMAQTCSSIVGQSFFEENNNTKVIGFITSIKKVSIFSLPNLGDEIITKASLVSQYENICMISCETFVGDQLLGNAEINLFIQEIPS
jgi:predicted hotdog family 3-hydroxylacyl-ACP dehydratase